MAIRPDIVIKDQEAMCFMIDESMTTNDIVSL